MSGGNELGVRYKKKAGKAGTLRLLWNAFRSRCCVSLHPKGGAAPPLGQIDKEKGGTEASASIPPVSDGKK